MNLYKNEKKRIGKMRWGIVGGILFFFFLFLQSQMTHFAMLQQQGIVTDTMPIRYNLGTVFWGNIILVCYLNSKLFYVKEREKSVYLLKKYEIVPVRIKTFYFVKIRIMVETILTLIGATIPIYFITLVANNRLIVDPNLVNGILYITGWAFAFLAITVLVMDVRVQGQG